MGRRKDRVSVGTTVAFLGLIEADLKAYRSPRGIARTAL
jgi:hypothetical protein